MILDLGQPGVLHPIDGVQDLTLAAKCSFLERESASFGWVRAITVIGLANFPSYTSGHSTFSAAAAEVLSYLFPSERAVFEAQKEEASLSRLYGGIHYRSDIEVGKDHGRRIAGYTLRFAMTDGADAR